MKGRSAAAFGVRRSAFGGVAKRLVFGRAPQQESHDHLDHLSV
jgi:hypothetical protein